MISRADSYDAVIIGAGHNGLVAANVLADAGWSVAVLEATSRPGGAIQSAELTAPGFVNDICSAFYPLIAAGSPLYRLNLEPYGLTLRHAPHVLGHVLPDGRAAILDRDPAVTAASVDEFSPGDGQRWCRMVDEWDRLSEGLLGALFTPFPPARAVLRLARAERVSGLLRLARRLVIPVRRLGAELFEGQGARMLLAGCALHTDLGPDEAGSGIYGWLLCMLGQRHGFPVPVGGAGEITAALLRRLEKAGGTVATGTPVTRIATRGGRAVGVVTADGTPVRARRAVLADVPAPSLYRDLVPAADLPPRLLCDLDHFVWDHGTVKVDWALSAPVPWRDPRLAAAGTVHLDSDMSGLSDYAHALTNGRIPVRPFLLLGQMTTADPTRSPAGTESVWAYTHLPSGSHWPADEITAHAERIEKVVEDHAPGFGARVIARHVLGPDDLARHDPSLVGGAIAGGTASIHQQLFLRPVPGLGRADTPVDRLFLCSSSAHPGGGVHGVPGANAARAALARDGAVTGPLYRLGVRTANTTIYRAAK